MRKNLSCLSPISVLTVLIVIGIRQSVTAASAPGVIPLPADSVAVADSDSIPSLKSDSVTDLNELTVVSIAKLVKSDGAKLTYDVSADPESKTSPIMEILRKVPGVTVDAEENIKVNGQSNFKVLKNNHEDPMFSSNLKNALKSIPASSIKRIEVISEPGAKYDAEGAGGILNIVTDNSTRLSGFMTSLGAWLSSWGAGGYVNHNQKLNNVMLGVRANYNNNYMFQKYNHSYSELEDLTGGPNHIQISNSKSKGGSQYVGAGLDLSWEPDTLNLYTLSVDYGFNDWNTTGEETRTMYGLGYDPLKPEHDVVWRLRRTTEYPGSYNSFSTNASYQHFFNSQDHSIVASYLFNYGRSKNDQEYVATYLLGEAVPDNYNTVRDKTKTLSHVVQLDYSNRFNSKHLLEAGAKANISSSRNIEGSYYGSTPDNLVVNPAQDINLEQFKDIYALYATYTGTFSKLTATGGLRYEHTRMGVKYKVGKYPDYTTHLNDLVPNASLAYNFTPASNLRLAYQWRIYRPSVGLVNPMKDTSTPGFVSYGNPDLKSENHHTASIAYSNYAGVVSGFANLTYQYSGNQIARAIFMKDDIINSTYVNGGTQHTARLQGNIDWNITNAIRLSGFGSVTYIHSKIESELMNNKACGWTGSFNINFNYMLPCKLRISAYGGYSSPYISYYSKGSSSYWYGLSLSRSFLKNDALSFYLSANNILPVSDKYHSSSLTDEIRSYNSGSYKQWGVSFNITWRFGELKSQVRRTSASVEAEKSVGGGGNQGGGQGGK